MIFGQFFAGLHRFVNDGTIGKYGRMVTLPEPVGLCGNKLVIACKRGPARFVQDWGDLGSAHAHEEVARPPCDIPDDPVCLVRVSRNEY